MQNETLVPLSKLKQSESDCDTIRVIKIAENIQG